MIFDLDKVDSPRVVTIRAESADIPHVLTTMLDASKCKHATFNLDMLDVQDLARSTTKHTLRNADVVIADGCAHASPEVQHCFVEAVTTYMRTDACVVLIYLEDRT